MASVALKLRVYNGYNGSVALTREAMMSNVGRIIESGAVEENGSNLNSKKGIGWGGSISELSLTS